jgi:hypothetical protein
MSIPKNQIILSIKTTAKQVEMANFLIAQAIGALESNPDKCKAFKLTKLDLKEAVKFRKNMIESFLNPNP